MSLVSLPSGGKQDSETELHSVVEEALSRAKEFGASSAVVKASRLLGYDVHVRLGEVETVEHHNEKDLGVLVYFGKSVGESSTSDFGKAAISETVRAACAIARHTADDPCNGLPDQNRLARDFPDLQLYNPWEIEREQAIEIAKSCEETATNFDSRIKNSNGAGVGSELSNSVFGNSDGFMASRTATRHSLFCSVIGESDAGMQSDYWGVSARSPGDLDTSVDVGRIAALRTVRRLNPRRIKSCEAPVLFESRIAGSLLAHFIGAITGRNLYRKTSFLLDSIGEQLFPEFVRIHEQPHLEKGAGSSACDGEGVATRPRDIVSKGVLTGYVLNSYSARKLGFETTGNAGGVFNLTIDSGSRDFDEMLKLMHRGLLVTEIMGQGVDLVTGNYSRGIAGFWVENGEVQFPVEEMTIAGNLREMYRGLVEVGADVDARRRIRTGSLLIENMTIGGE